MSSLHGLRILNTRPKEQAQALNEIIRDSGGISIECPTLEIIASQDNWIDLLPNLNQVHHAIFVSPNAVKQCFFQINNNALVWPVHINVIAIGEGTAKSLNNNNIRVDEIPALPDSEHLLKLTSLQNLNTQTVLLFKGEGGRTVLEESIQLKEANLITLIVYKRVMPNICQQLINSIWRDDLVDIILLTSEESIHNLFNMFSKEAHHWIKNKPCLVISNRLAQSASLLGIKRIIISHPNQMIKALFDYKD
jgi:uroporphyrinogen-III synthase